MSNILDAKSKIQDRAAILSRIAAALRGEVPLQDLDPLLQSAGVAVNEARNLASELRQWALNPGLPQEDVAIAREQADTAEFDAARMQSAFGQLEDKAAAYRDEVKRANHIRRYEAARERSEQCAVMIREDYPKVFDLLLPMIKEIVAAGVEVDEANTNLPPGAVPLNRPEGIARGFTDRGSHNLPVFANISRIAQMVLPIFHDPRAVAWPVGYFQHRDGPMQPPFSWFLALYRHKR